MKKTVKTRLIVSFKNDFIPFLESNQACKDYMSNVLARHRREWNKDKVEVVQNLIYETLQNTYPGSWISGVFTWCETDQGQTFWSDINTQWQKLLRNEAGTKDFEEFGEVSKSDVEELFFPKTLRGRYYRVTDLSYNRPVIGEWDCREWKLCDPSVELNKTGGIYLILSDYPEDKVMLWHGAGAVSRPMIKVWIPELDRAQWVFFNEYLLQSTE